MTELLETIFGELGIAQYLDAFLEQGFDTWETILDITESDLDALGVKLGHRRKLQRRIANFRGVAPDASLVSPTQSNAEEVKFQDAVKTESPTPGGRGAITVVVTKRKYRRHPKPDENAPERPPSAYVLFSNKMREELKGRNLSFAEIAKLVGVNWQNLTAAEKEPFESQAQAIKDKYLSDLAVYKQTPEYRKYQAYLKEFKAKHGSPSQDKDGSKRLRLSELGAQSRGSPNVTPTRTSRSGSGAESRRGSEPPSSTQRLGSVASPGDSQYATSLASPASVASPDQPVISPVVSNAERHSSGLSPAFNPDSRNQAPPPPRSRHSGQGDDQGRAQLSMHKHLPSLSDVFDGQELPGGGRSSSEPNGFRPPPDHVAGNPGPGTGHVGGSTHSAPPPSGHPYVGNSTSLHFYAQLRPPVDGPLPIHALLASKPEPPHHSSQPAHLPHENPFLVDQKPRLLHQAPNGVAGLPVLHVYHTPGSLLAHQTPNHHQYQHHGASAHHVKQTFPTHAPPAPGPPPESPQQGRQNASLDGMSALLKAGEIVDRSMQ
ncbi:uncharacterized protein THITE_2121767 [Thermothielavioides terrestris NRRL 8126]|uniref:HMG box domain-containing protein n=1 Tax=Thermothielavioides terrestris (strain ATCC 38088 / NRRL 8126) TaxID=578455 RepID=G2RFA0_THETT|nr:uncharacterized protein THITE_2121767 [Thermothielavioides terrestris NRRL 8126]AEO70383.1 hypothetical protein THITE_2121767 [Thermothielavioides terrestris NRRL 8126]